MEPLMRDLSLSPVPFAPGAPRHGPAAATAKVTASPSRVHACPRHVAALSIALLSCGSLPAVAEQRIELFTDGLLDWQPKRFNGETQYRWIASDGRGMLEAHSRASASGLVRKIGVDLTKTPYLHWHWRVEDIFSGNDETRKSGDDYPARVYVVVSGGLLFWRTRAVNYVWASHQPQGSTWPNAYTGNARMMALRSGDGERGVWREERRDVRADLRLLFGEDITHIDAVAVMTDTGDTGLEATAFYQALYCSDEQVAAQIARSNASRRSGAFEHSAPAREQRVGLVLRQGPADEETLYLIAARLAQEGELFGCLHALRHHVEAQAPRHGDDGGDDGRVVLIGLHVADEGAVDLESLDREALEIAQRRIARAEIVDGEAHAHAVERGDIVARDLVALHQHALGDLELEQLGFERRQMQDMHHLLTQTEIAELPARQVHGDAQRAVLLPRRGPAAGLFQDPVADRHDEAGRFEQWDEFERVHQPEIGVAPAQQGLETGDVPRREIDLRLVVMTELLALQRAAQAGVEAEPLERLHAHVRGIILIGAAALILRAIHRDVGVLEQGVGVVAVLWIDAHADAGVDIELVAFDVKGLRKDVEYLSREGRGTVERHAVLEQYPELVAAETGDGVAGIDAVGQDRRDLAQ